MFETWYDFFIAWAVGIAFLSYLTATTSATIIILIVLSRG